MEAKARKGKIVETEREGSKRRSRKKKKKKKKKKQKKRKMINIKRVAEEWEI